MGYTERDELAKFTEAPKRLTHAARQRELDEHVAKLEAMHNDLANTVERLQPRIERLEQELDLDSPR